MLKNLDREKCRLCHGKLDEEVEALRERNRDFSKARYWCARCGPYVIDGDFEWGLAAVAGDANTENRIAPETYQRYGEIDEKCYLLSGWTREQHVRNEDAPFLDEETGRAVIQDSPTSVTEKIERLLLNLAEMSGDEPAATHDLVIGNAYPLGFAKDGDGFRYQVDYLHRAGLIKDPAMSMGGDEGRAHLQISIPGWEQVREIRHSGSDSDRAFVAMSFSTSMESVWDEAIKPAIEGAGYRPIRVDKEEHVERIDDKIQVELNRSRFVVAEFTEHKHGVYFEAGYALGRGIPVIWTCHRDDLEDAHFDTEHYNHIVWSDEGELRSKLEIRIRAVVP